MHPRDGTIRAHLDRQLSVPEQNRLEEHLSKCARCLARLQRIEQQTRFVRSQMVHLESKHAPWTSPGGALSELKDRIPRKEKEPMLRKTKWRPLWVGLSIALAIALAMSFPQVRAVANNFLGLFRVERVQVVQVEVPPFTESQLSETTLTNLEQFFADQVTFEGGGDSIPVKTVEEASALAAFEVRLPTSLGDPVELRVERGGRVTFQIDVELANAILAELGQKEVRLPESVNNATVEVVIPDVVFAAYGTCFTASAEPEAVDEATPVPAVPLDDYNCTTLIQMPSPTVNAPEELNLIQLGEAYLQILGMSREEAQSFARNVDWTSTFVIPIPRYSTQYRDLEVDGVLGTYIKYEGEYSYLLIWVRQGIIYALSGQGGAEVAQDIANSMR